MNVAFTKEAKLISKLLRTSISSRVINDARIALSVSGYLLAGLGARSIQIRGLAYPGGQCMARPPNTCTWI